MYNDMLGKGEGRRRDEDGCGCGCVEEKPGRASEESVERQQQLGARLPSLKRTRTGGVAASVGTGDIDRQRGSDRVT